MFSGVNCSQVLRYIRKNLGAIIQQLELTDDEMMRVVLQESRVTYSKFFPYIYRDCLTQKDAIDEQHPNTYRLHNEDRLEIIGVHNKWLSTTNQFGTSMLPITNEPFSQQLFNDFTSATLTPVTCQYIAPDLVTIRPRIYRNDGALVAVKAVHPEHLRTIPMSMRDEFFRLCLDDVLIALLPVRKRYANLQTIYGQIDVFVEMVDQAENDRRELLDKWHANAIKRGNTKKIWIA